MQLSGQLLGPLTLSLTEAEFIIHVVTFDAVFVIYQYLCQWMDDILENHGDIVTACLLPHPLECFKVASC